MRADSGKRECIRVWNMYTVGEDNCTAHTHAMGAAKKTGKKGKREVHTDVNVSRGRLNRKRRTILNCEKWPLPRGSLDRLC